MKHGAESQREDHVVWASDGVLHDIKFEICLGEEAAVVQGKWIFDDFHSCMSSSFYVLVAEVPPVNLQFADDISLVFDFFKEFFRSLALWMIGWCHCHSKNELERIYFDCDVALVSVESLSL